VQSITKEVSKQMEMTDLKSLYEGVTALRQAVDKGWNDQRAETKSLLEAEIKRVSEEIDKKFADIQKALDDKEVERRMRFAGEELSCKYGEPPLVRKAINEVKKEYMGSKGGGKPEDMKFQDFLSVIMSGYPGGGQRPHPMLEKLPRMTWDVDGMQTKRLLEDGGFFGPLASTGGYLVFPEYMAEILPFLRQTGVIRRLARVIPMAGLIMNWPTNTVGSTWAWIAATGGEASERLLLRGAASPMRLHSSCPGR
jgi:HK97 family phage major capsid protein